MIKIGVIEDDHFVRDELVTMIQASTKLEYVLSSESAENFLKYFPEYLDIILLDINLPGMSGIEAIPLIKKKSPNTEVVILTIYDDSNWIFKALQEGATGYILKGDSIDLIEKTLVEVKEGIPALSPSIARRMISFFKKKPSKVINVELTTKESQVLKYLIDGLSYKLIAAEMELSINNIRYYVKNIYKKLHIHSRPELVKLYLDGEIDFNM